MLVVVVVAIDTFGDGEILLIVVVDYDFILKKWPNMPRPYQKIIQKPIF